MQNLQNELIDLLKHEDNLVIDGHLNKNKIVELALKVEPQLISLLIKNETFKKHFFQEVENVLVFDKIKFQRFVNNKSFLPDSYTAFKNKIGLITNDDDLDNFISTTNDVVLAWPHKDCVLEGGQTKEDQKRNEIFWNETLAPDSVDRLLDAKVLTNFKKFDKDGEHKVTELKGDENLIIKGNNLLALASLLKIHRGKIKLIYIDPPYNTGNDGFNYNDSFNHSSWLTFMKNRLILAKKLLREDGVIFVQCDDNEQAYLKILMDEIFFRENFIANLIWEKKTGASDAKEIATITEFSIIFSKNKEKVTFSKNTKSYDLNRYKLKDKYYDKRGQYYIDNLDRGGLQYSDSLNYGITCPDGSITFPNGRSTFLNDGWIWKWSKKKIEWAIENEFIEFRESKSKESGWSVCYKNYLFVDNENNPIERSAPHKNLITGILNTHASSEINKLFGSKVFATPKPEKLLETIIDLSTKENDIVLDYHLGSGTTSAVAHKMKRKYIGIEQMDYIETVAVERLKMVVSGEQGGISKDVNWLGGGSFVYVELMQYNQKYFELIQNAETKEQLISVWNDMQETAFLSYQFDKKTFNERLEAFKTAPIEDMKQYLIEVLDKNQLYVNYSEINDETFNVSQEDKELNKQFYSKK
jgi:adenine-specific DNA-methyltransferase